MTPPKRHRNVFLLTTLGWGILGASFALSHFGITSNWAGYITAGLIVADIAALLASLDAAHWRRTVVLVALCLIALLLIARARGATTP